MSGQIRLATLRVTVRMRRNVSTCLNVFSARSSMCLRVSETVTVVSGRVEIELPNGAVVRLTGDAERMLRDASRRPVRCLRRSRHAESWLYRGFDDAPYNAFHFTEN